MPPEGPPPEAKETKAFEKPPAWAIAIAESVNEVKGQVAGARADISLVANEVSLVKERVGLVEQRVSVVETARAATSERVKGESKTNEDQNAAIALLHTKVDALDVKVETETTKQTAAILARFDKLARTPQVKMLVTALITALTTYIATGHFH